MEFVAVQNDPYTRDLHFRSALTPKPVADVIAINGLPGYAVTSY